MSHYNRIHLETIMKQTCSFFFRCVSFLKHQTCTYMYWYQLRHQVADRSLGSLDGQASSLRLSSSTSFDRLRCQNWSKGKLWKNKNYRTPCILRVNTMDSCGFFSQTDRVKHSCILLPSYFQKS